MKEILQLFRRDAEIEPPTRGAESYTGYIGGKSGILVSREGSGGYSRGGSADGSRPGSSGSRGPGDNSVIFAGERRRTPPVKARASREEHPVYGRR
jgi:hypothetical protein